MRFSCRQSARALLHEEPRLFLAPIHLKLFDFFSILQSKPNLIQSIEQTMSAEGIDFEPVNLTSWCGYRLRVQIYFQLKPIRCHGIPEQLIDDRRLQHDGQKADLK